MAGIGMLALLIGCAVLWSGAQDLSAWDVLKATLSGAPLPAYVNDAGLRKAIAELFAFELIKSAATGLSSLIPQGGAQGGGGSGEDETTPTDEATPEGDVSGGASAIPEVDPVEFVP
jgi:hypothetical protein